MKRHWILKGIGFGILAAAFIFAVGWVVMMLWNWLMPEIFTGANEISYWQAMGILLLSKILFGWGRGCRGRGHWQGRQDWRTKMRDKWNTMSPEEREKFKGSWGRYCNWEIKVEEEPKAKETV